MRQDIFLIFLRWVRKLLGKFSLLLHLFFFNSQFAIASTRVIIFIHLIFLRFCATLLYGCAIAALLAAGLAESWSTYTVHTREIASTRNSDARKIDAARHSRRPITTDRLVL